MGGLGSGRPEGFGRKTVESYRTIDVNQFNRAGCLSPGWTGGWRWQRDGSTVASIVLQAGHGQLTLVYRMRINGGYWKDVNEAIRIVDSPCRFGGKRPYFVCPACQRRVVKLHIVSGYFRCRDCCSLVHTSQSEAPWYRAIRRANKIRVRLGGEPGINSDFPSRPKGMWQCKYEQLRDEVFEAERFAESSFLESNGQLGETGNVVRNR